MKRRWSSGAPVHVLHCFSTAAAAAAVGAASFCTYTNFLFHFPFDEIYLSASSLSATTAAAAAAAATVGGAASFCAYSLQNFLFHLPFDEIYQRLLFSSFFTLGRSVSA